VTPGDTDTTPEELTRIAGSAGVHLALAASVGDGLVLHVAGEAADRAAAAAALGAALFARARSAAAACGHGEPRLLRLQCSGGQLLATAAGPTVLIAVAEPAANTGRIRLELLRAAEALA
jgi:predicted regulator of Ras-like GTPase activity (Roadblock/LC7/MglB family)